MIDREKSIYAIPGMVEAFKAFGEFIIDQVYAHNLEFGDADVIDFIQSQDWMEEVKIIIAIRSKRAVDGAMASYFHGLSREQAVEMLTRSRNVKQGESLLKDVLPESFDTI